MKAQPGTAIADCASIHGLSGIERRAHAAADVSQNRANRNRGSQIRGPTLALSVDGWPIVNGSTVRLFGVDTIAPDEIGRFISWIKTHGDYLECAAVPPLGSQPSPSPLPDGATYRCFTRDHLDVAEAILPNPAPFGRACAIDQGHRQSPAPHPQYNTHAAYHGTIRDLTTAELTQQDLARHRSDAETPDGGILGFFRSLLR